MIPLIRETHSQSLRGQSYFHKNTLWPFHSFLSHVCTQSFQSLHDIAQKFPDLWPPPVALPVEGGVTPRWDQAKGMSRCVWLLQSWLAHRKDELFSFLHASVRQALPRGQGWRPASTQCNLSSQRKDSEQLLLASDPVLPEIKLIWESPCACYSNKAWTAREGEQWLIYASDPNMWP